MKIQDYSKLNWQFSNQFWRQVNNQFGDQICDQLNIKLWDQFSCRPLYWPLYWRLEELRLIK